MILYVNTLGTDKLPVQGVRFVLTFALAVSLIRGWNPGRWITIVLLSIGVIMVVVGLAQSGNSILLIFLGVIYAACVVALLTPFAGLHFQRRSGR